MSPEEASTLTLLAEVPEEYPDIRDDLLGSLSGEAREIGEVLLAPPEARQEFSDSSREAAAEFEPAEPALETADESRW